MRNGDIGDEELLVLNPMGDPFFDDSDAPLEPAARQEPKRERLTFAMLGIPVGAELTYKDDPTVVVKVADDKSGVEYEGRIYKMSALIRHLRQGGSWQGGEYLLYKGKKLTAIRKEMEDSAGAV